MDDVDAEWKAADGAGVALVACRTLLLCLRHVHAGPVWNLVHISAAPECRSNPSLHPPSHLTRTKLSNAVRPPDEEARRPSVCPIWASSLLFLLLHFPSLCVLSALLPFALLAPSCSLYLDLLTSLAFSVEAYPEEGCRRH